MRRRRLVAALAALLPLAFAATATAERPNVMIVISDDQRDDAMKVMRSARQIFGAGGTEFTNGYVTTPLCCPSRSSIFTGQYVHNHGVRGNEGQDPFPHRTTLQRELSLAGYETSIFGKFINGWPDRVKPPHFDVAKLGYGTEPRRADRRTGQNVRAFLERREREDERPWFTVYAARAPHAPHVPLRRFERARVPRFKPRPSLAEETIADKSPRARALAREQRRHRKRDKAGRQWRGQQRTLLGLDVQIRKTFETLRRLGESRSTLVFYISDNGYSLGEHRLLRKGIPYRESIEVPLFMRWAGHVPRGVADDRLAANIDLAPTIYDAVGIEPSYTVDGYSLLGPHRREYALAEHFDAPWHWSEVFDPASRYIESYDRAGGLAWRELYDLRVDPFEMENLLYGSPSPSSQASAALDARRLERASRCAGASCP